MEGYKNMLTDDVAIIMGIGGWIFPIDQLATLPDVYLPHGPIITAGHKYVCNAQEGLYLCT